MNIFDYPHIQEAIANVKKDLKYKKRTCVVATMGIGKSAIATSTMIDNKDKSIIFSAPRHFILEQIKEHLKNMGYDVEKDFKNLRFYTYAQMHAMIKKGNVMDFDLLICDEFHAIAKKKQYESISQLFRRDTDKMYLGLSATPILQWEYEIASDSYGEETKRRVNMAKTLYDDNVSFYYSLDDAFADGLFAVPIYDEFFVLSRNPREEATEILKGKVGDQVREEQIDELVDYLNREAGIVPILKKYMSLKNTKIMFYCRDFNDLQAKERLLRKEFPDLDIYKTSCRLPKKDNDENLKEFRNDEFKDGNSKVLLSIRQMTEGFHTDGTMQIIFGNKTKAYRDFLQKFGRGCSLGNFEPVKILDLGGNLTRISSLDFLNFNSKRENRLDNKASVPGLSAIKFGGNIEDLNNYIESICQVAFVSLREKTDIYLDRIMSNNGYLKDEKEKYKDGTFIRNWHKEMLKIAKEELKLYKGNSEYEISKDNMYVIEALAYLEDYMRGRDVLTEDKRQDEYYTKAISYGNVLPKDDTYRFQDGVYMSTWYSNRIKRAKDLLKKLEASKEYTLSKDDYELLVWLHNTHEGLKEVWLNKMLGLQRASQENPKYQDWKIFSQAVDNDPKLLNTKKLCEGIETFYELEEYFNGVEKRMTDYASQCFPYAKMNMEDLGKHLSKNYSCQS